MACGGSFRPEGNSAVSSLSTSSSVTYLAANSSASQLAVETNSEVRRSCSPWAAINASEVSVMSLAMKSANSISTATGMSGMMLRRSHLRGERQIISLNPQFHQPLNPHVAAGGGLRGLVRDVDVDFRVISTSGDVDPPGYSPA